ncbi:FAD synthase [Candidatus Roizmanbacteria bacterium]|nr:FAD synthase [Candidatus Roizmanbacteria bacterium]
MTKKIYGYNELLLLTIKQSSKKLVLVGGCFDIFHYGHLRFLYEARRVGDALVVALESDDFIRIRKQREPIHTQEQRAEILASLDIVDFIVLLPFFSGYSDYLAFIQQIKPSIIAVTDQDPNREEKQRQAESVGAKLEVVCPLILTPSTTSIIRYASIFSN